MKNEDKKKRHSNWMIISIVVLICSFSFSIFYYVQSNRSYKIDPKEFAKLNECRCKPTLFNNLSDAGKKRCSLFEKVSGNVVEIGSGSGVNFVCWYSREICTERVAPLVDQLTSSSEIEGRFCNKLSKYIAVDPNQHHKDVLLRNYDFYNLTFDLSFENSIKLIESNSIDSVISTHVLCSVDDIEMMLNEIKRVLRIGGRYFFYEHIKGDKGSLLEITQKVCEPFWCYYYGGCRFIDIRKYIEKMDGFMITEMKELVDEKKNILVAPHIFGIVEKIKY